jgi:hypothetical protein
MRPDTARVGSRKAKRAVVVSKEARYRMHQLAVAALLLLALPRAEPASDFAFRLENAACRYERVDTFSGTFSMFRSAPLPLHLSAEQRDAIFQAIEAAHFLDLPASTRPLPKTGNRIGFIALEVRNAGRSHRVVTTGNARAPEDQVVGRLFEKIFDVVRLSSPEIERLSRGDGCYELAGAPQSSKVPLEVHIRSLVAP